MMEAAWEGGRAFEGVRLTGVRFIGVRFMESGLWDEEAAVRLMSARR